MMPQPRRTRRCDTCRDRRIRCDEVRPRCGQCTKGKRRCVVSKENLAFQVWTPEKIYSAPETTSRSPSLNIQRRDGTSSPSARPYNGSRLETQLSDLSLSQVWAQFLQLQFPCTASSIGEFNSSLWQSLTQMDTSSQSLRHALGAIASARIGLIKRNNLLYQNSGHLYGTAVSHLREEIREGTQRTTISVIATVLTLAAYEFYQDTTSSGFGYISHAQGASQLIESLGPSHFISGTSHKLFLNFRELGVVHAIFGRKKTFLAKTKWLNRPWNIHEKSDFNKLLDIAVAIPALFEESYTLKTSSDNLANSLRQTLIERYWKTWDNLLLWHKEYTAGSDLSPVYTTHEWNSSLEGQKSPWTSQGPFSNQLQFRNVETAKCLIFYWSFICCISSGIAWEHRALFGRGTDYKTCSACSKSVQRACLCGYKPPELHLNEADMRPPPSLLETFAIADQISMSIPYLLQKNLKGVGAEICVWPLRVIHEVYRFRNEEQKVSWTLGVFKELEQWGISWSASLLGMQFPDYQNRALLGNMAVEHLEAGFNSSVGPSEHATIEIRNFKIV